MAVLPLLSNHLVPWVVKNHPKKIHHWRKDEADYLAQPTPHHRPANEEIPNSKTAINAVEVAIAIAITILPASKIAGRVQSRGRGRMALRWLASPAAAAGGEGSPERNGRVRRAQGRRRSSLTLWGPRVIHWSHHWFALARPWAHFRLMGPALTQHEIEKPIFFERKLKSLLTIDIAYILFNIYILLWKRAKVHFSPSTIYFSP